MTIEDLLTSEVPEDTKKMIRSLNKDAQELLIQMASKGSDYDRYIRVENVLKKYVLDTSMNQELYHYTSITNLKKILHSKQWLIKRYNYMNDPSEMKWALKMANIMLAQNEDIQLIKSFNDMFRANPFNDLYIWSFSLNNHNQALFGNYSHGEDGIAIKFKAQEVQNTLATTYAHGKQDPNKFQFGDSFVGACKVEYDIDIQKKYISKIVDFWVTAYKNRSKDQYDMNEIMKRCMITLVFLSMIFKNPYLSQEEEIRFLVINKNSDASVHADKIIDGIPYMKTKLNNKLIKEIINKTGNNITTSEITKIINEMGFSEIEVTSSDLPYQKKYFYF